MKEGCSNRSIVGKGVMRTEIKILVSVCLFAKHRCRERERAVVMAGQQSIKEGESTIIFLLNLGRRVTVVVLSFIHSVNRATESSAHFFAPVKV